MPRKVLIGGAWPYVNGSLHFGHLASLLPGDILARYHRAKGHDVLYVSGSDCHGTPILVAAEQAGTSAAELAQQYHREFTHLFEVLGFSWSLYSATMGDFHRGVAQNLFLEIFNQGNMVEKEEEQAFCLQCNRFLADRYIQGECPHCHHDKARGDQCDECGRTLVPEELLLPKCRTCRSIPEWRTAKHLYFRLPLFQDKVTAWSKQQQGWRRNAVSATKAWLDQGLQDRPVTRDLSWGVPVPVIGYEDKCVYVWFEAVMGYLSCSMQWAAQKGTPDVWREWWENPDAVHYYVHGKDNIPFHTIIWPAMLMALGLRLPDKIISSEYLNFGSGKFSKSSGVGIFLPAALQQFDPDVIRFFLTLNNPEQSDTNFQWQDFGNRINGDLIGNLGNFCNRTISMAYRYLQIVPQQGELLKEAKPLLEEAEGAFEVVGAFIEAGEFRRAIQAILALSANGNRFLEQREPWKHASDKAHVGTTLYVALQVVETLCRLAMPFVPHGAEKIATCLGMKDTLWTFTNISPGASIGEPVIPFAKILPGIIEAENAKLQA